MKRALDKSRFSLAVGGPFSLEESGRFLAGWPPAKGIAIASTDGIRLAFVLDGFRCHAGVHVRQERESVQGELVGTDEVGTVRAQVARLLSLDHDASDYSDVGERDPVIGRLQAQFPGLRPVLFHSPYEAAGWSIISARLHPRQAFATRERLSCELGAVLDVAGEEMAAFPLPEQLLELDRFPRLPQEKLRRLQGVAEAALSGRLDAERLRALPPEQALAQLRQLRGIGPFYATLILLRSTGLRDELPPAEPRLRILVQRAYGLAEPPDEAKLAGLAEGWRPYRTWVAALLRASEAQP